MIQSLFSSVRTLGFCLLSAFVCAACPNSSSAGVITAVGSVTAMTDVSQFNNVVGVGDFNEGPTSGAVDLNVYAAQGLTFHTGTFSSILAGVTTVGFASQPNYDIGGTFFPGPIAGGGIQSGAYNHFAGVATFDSALSITQFGLTAATNGDQHITVWDKSGTLLGQVNWDPASNAAFVGIDTGGVAIGMVAYGNDDLFNGENYSIGGNTIFSDTWMWGGTSVVPEPTSVAIFGTLFGVPILSRRRKS